MRNSCQKPLVPCCKDSLASSKTQRRSSLSLGTAKTWQNLNTAQLTRNNGFLAFCPICEVSGCGNTMCMAQCLRPTKLTSAHLAVHQKIAHCTPKSWKHMLGVHNTRVKHAAAAEQNTGCTTFPTLPHAHTHICCCAHYTQKHIHTHTKRSLACLRTAEQMPKPCSKGRRLLQLLAPSPEVTHHCHLPHSSLAGS